MLQGAKARDKIKLRIVKRKLLRDTAVKNRMGQRTPANFDGGLGDIDSSWFSSELRCGSQPATGATGDIQQFLLPPRAIPLRQSTIMKRNI